jgi:hypothetical protein
MTSNPFDIDSSEALAAAIQRREDAAKEAEAELLNQAHILVGEIEFKVYEALNGDTDNVLPTLQAILDGTGKTETVTVNVPVEVEKIVEKTIPDAQIVEDLEALRKENQELKTDKGRLEVELKKLKEKPSNAETTKVEPRKSRGTLRERTMHYLTEKEDPTPTERSSS